MLDLDQQDRFVLTRRRGVRLSPSLSSVDICEFALADAGVDAPALCHVRQRLSRCNQRIGFYSDDARTAALMYLISPPRFDPWARYELIDDGLDTIGAIQKAFVARQRRSHYVLYGADGDQVARIEAQVPVAVGRRRAAGVAVAAGAGALGIPFVGAAGVIAIASIAAAATIRQVRNCVDPIDVAPQLRIARGDHTLGVILRRSLTTWPGPPTLPAPWASTQSVYEIDMSADASHTVDRRLVLAVPVAFDALRGVFAESPLR